MSLSGTAFAASRYDGGLKIDRLVIENTRVSFGFTRKPNDCIDLDGYYHMHASLSASKPQYKEKLAILLTARSTGKAIDIWYEDLGDCVTQADLLQIETLGFSYEGLQ